MLSRGGPGVEATRRLRPNMAERVPCFPYAILLPLDFHAELSAKHAKPSALHSHKEEGGGNPVDEHA
jgi:hypothetical protein